MTGNITWETVFGVAAIIGAVLAIWFRLESRIKNAQETASLVGLAAQAKVEIVNQELANYKLHVSETYASMDGVNRQFEAVSKSIIDFSVRMETRLDGMNERLDRVIEAGKASGRGTN